VEGVKINNICVRYVEAITYITYIIYLHRNGIEKKKGKVKVNKRRSAKNEARKRAREIKKSIDVCEVCGGSGKLHVHHIDRDVFNNAHENLVKLCIQCHIEEHS
jgi:hypothetical protein